MKIKQNSYLDIDKLKIGDLLYTPELVKDGKKYKCDFNVFKIKEFYTNKDKKYDKYSVILSPLQIINADGTYKFDESDSAEVKGSIKNGFCTKETQKEYALKEINITNKKFYDSYLIMREVNILKKLDDPNVVSFNTSEASLIINGFLKSGLSDP